MKLTAPRYGYSLASITNTARHDSEFSREDSGIRELLEEGRMKLIIAEPTKAQREQYNLPAGDRWRESDGAGEYEDSHIPMMCSLWPVDIQRDERECADLINRHAGATSLVEIDDSYYIAMTGGGMDLSWHLAAAYVCCGCVPPIEILSSLRDSPFRLAATVTREILRAWRQGEAWLNDRARRLSEQRRDTAKQVKERRAV